MYKVGDRVRYIEGNIDCTTQLIGHVGTVVKVYEHEGEVDGVRVRFDTGDTGTADIGWGCSLGNLEPWTDKPAFDTYPVKVLLQILENNRVPDAGEVTTFHVDVVKDLSALRIRTQHRILFWIDVPSGEVWLAHDYDKRADRDVRVARTDLPTTMVRLGRCIERFRDQGKFLYEWYDFADEYYRNGA